MTSLADRLMAALAARGDRAGVVETSSGGTRTASCAEIAHAIGDGAARLEAAGVSPGEVVSIHLPRAVEALVASFAARLAGAVPCALPPDAATAPCAAWAWRALDAPPVRAPGLAAGHVPPEIAWLRPTGGTTGVPRLAGFTEAQALAFAERSRHSLDLAVGERFVTTAYPWTAYGWNTGLVSPLLGGLTVVIVPPVSPRALLEAIRGQGARFAATTPPVVRALARTPAFRAAGSDPRCSDGMRILVAGAAYPTEDALRVREVHGIDVLDRYGGTETGAVAQAREPGGPLWALPGAILNAAGDPAVLEVRGDVIAWGYVGQPGAAPVPFHGVVRTADRVEFAADGSFRLVGRADRIVKRAGKVVDLAAVERALASLPGVALARVRPCPGALDVELEGEVVAREGVRLDGQALVRDLAARCASWECPGTIAVHERAPEGAWMKWTAADSP